MLKLNNADQTHLVLQEILYGGLKNLLQHVKIFLQQNWFSQKCVVFGIKSSKEVNLFAGASLVIVVRGFD